MSYMFNECYLLISLPHISKWKPSNLKNINYMFSECPLLISLPDISNFNTSKVRDMSALFSGCTSLLSLPSISKLFSSNSKLHEIRNKFAGCLNSINPNSKQNKIS